MEKLIESKESIKPLEDKKTELKIEEPKGSLKIAPKKIEIIMSEKTNNFIEGDVLDLKAILIMTDGSKKDITKECKWQVLGKIGNMEGSGFFRAKLDASISELGQAAGQIICSFIDSKTGQTFLGSTPIIKVEAKIEEDFETRG